MSVDPAARMVHPRRRHEYLDASGVHEAVLQKVYHRGVFEALYGYPTNVDMVWAVREQEQLNRDMLAAVD